MGHCERAVCAVDVGTSAVRAALVTPEGKTLRLARRPRDGDVAHTFDAEVLWRDLVAVLRDLHGAAEVTALAMAGHIGAVAVDAGGAAVAPAGGWADDRGLEPAAMAARCGPAGRPVPTGGGLALLHWLRTRSTTARWLLSPKDFLVHRLTGEAATDRTSAAYTMAFDVRRSGWAADLGADAAYFPPVHPATAVVGRVTTAAAERTGLPAGLPILAGGPDGTVGVAAVAGTGTGVIVDVAGTTDVIARLHAEPHTAPDAILNPYLVEGLWTVGGPTGMTGGAVAALAGLTGGDPGLADAGDLPAGSDGLLVLPSLTGSRFPDWRPAERGALCGLTPAHRPEHVVHAAHEAAAYLVREAVSRLDSPGGDTAPVLIGGGAIRAPWQARLRADVLGRPVLVSAEPDVSLRGAAMLALVGAGEYPDLRAAHRALAPDVRRYEPDPRRGARYDELFAAWRTVREAIRSAGERER